VKNNQKQHDPTAIPYLTDLPSFYKHVGAKAPLYADIDIRQIDPQVVKDYDYVAKPFRHSFYCITLFLEGDINLNAGYWKARLNKPAIFFKTPCQIVSWLKPERTLREYFIVFTEQYLRNNKPVADLIFDLPFVQLEQAIPFELEPEEIDYFTRLYKQIYKEFHAGNNDKFALISVYLQTLLLQLRRLYNKYAPTDNLLISHVRDREYSLVEQYRKLVRKSFADNPIHKSVLSVRYFADQLSIHPNHLNAVSKRQTQKTAMAILHEQILAEAQTLLRQTEITIKEVSSRLGFANPSYFNKFFKKNSGQTPASYRKDGVL
jgi:AraC family transcriptional activator of pobA